MRRLTLVLALCAAGCQPINVRDVTYVNNVNCDNVDIIRGVDRQSDVAAGAQADAITQAGQGAVEVAKALNYAVTIRCRDDEDTGAIEDLDAPGDGTENTP